MQNKQQEFLKQKERLKYVSQGHIGTKVLDPDIMIEQLISDKETFKFNPEPQLPYTLPKWLKVQNNLVPAVYDQVWQAVKLGPSHLYCDTQIITQFFTSSGLTLEKLGYLWSLTNFCSPGILTQQELYVMLALIALVQTGYHVKDISIIKNINHPILPQLDYSFLNITVANPAINRSTTKQPSQESKFNGLSNAFNSVPTNDGFKVNNEISALDFSCSSPNSISLDNEFENLSLNRVSEMRKTDMDVTFAIPEIKKVDYNVNLFDVDKQTTELDVDFPISELKPSSTATMVTENTTFKDPTIPPLLQKPPANGRKKFDLLSTASFTSNMEPKSLDLPIFRSEPSAQEDDEFSEFQSATIIPNAEEYADFQSASPIPKYEFDNFVNDETAIEYPKLEDDSNLPAKDQLEDTYSINDDMTDYKTSRDADKYDVFRTLVQHEEEQKPMAEPHHNDETPEVEEKEEDEFGEFYAADLNVHKEKSKLSIREKCLNACLQILQEGLTILSDISKEETIREVMSDERGYKYFNQLKIVYETSQRFLRQCESQDLNDAVQSTWAKLSSYTKYLPSEDLLEDMYVGEDDVDLSSCKLCETKCDVNCVRYAGNYYHVTCINLFLHFVEDSEISAMLNL